jgi:hypothetical protein
MYLSLTSQLPGGLLGARHGRLDFIRAKPEEQQWDSIPWQTDLWEARRLAAEEDEPIFPRH